MGLILKGIELENFKSFINKQYIQISDLSILLGANSSGKSTALQALLMLKQTMECNSIDEELLLSGKYVTLGDYDDVISGNKENSFSIGTVLEDNEKSENRLDTDQYRIKWYFNRDEDGISGQLSSIDIHFENIVLNLKRNKENSFDLYQNGEQNVLTAIINNLKLIDFSMHYDKELNKKAAEFLNFILQTLNSSKTPKVSIDKPVGIDIKDDFYWRLFDKIPNKKVDDNAIPNNISVISNRMEKIISDFCDIQLPLKNYDFSLIMEKDLRVKILELSLIECKDISHLESKLTSFEEYLKKYEKFKPNISEFQGTYNLERYMFWGMNRNDERDEKNSTTQLRYALTFYDDFYEDILKNIFFVGPIREAPKGLYSIGFESDPQYVGPTGSYFASVLLHENKKEKNYILPDTEEKCTLSKALAEWMIHLNIASGVNVEKNNSFGFSVLINNIDRVQADIMNVGIGTSQVLPVLISLLVSKPGEILIFEQPELHLHPYSQSRLADMFVQFCKNGRKIIVETHSEYFLLRLRYHIVKNNLSTQMIVVNFFNNDEGTKVESADISGFGNIKYPIGFRDETQELLDSLLEAALERKGL